MKSIAYNSSRRFLIISLSSFCFSLIYVACLLTEYNSDYPNYVFSSLGIIAILILISKKFGLISIPSLLSIILFVPCLSPFFAHILFRADYYSYNSKFLQDDVSLVNKTCFVIFSASMIYCFVLFFFENRKKLQSGKSISSNFVLGKGFFVTTCCLFLFFCWLTDPGPLLLFVDYVTMLQARYKGTQFAGAFVVIFWSLAFINYRNYKSTILRKFFEIITCIGLLWLLLHAGRSELIGIGCIWLLYAVGKTSSKKVFFYALLFFFSLVLIGNIRNRAILSQSLGGMLNSISFVRSSAEVAKFAPIPGGASNVFVTMLDSIYLIDGMNYGFLNGKTYFQYLYNMIPLNLINILNLPAPSYFYQILAKNFQYNGGTYIFAPAYANFGVLGILFMGAFLGKMVIFAHNNFRSDSFLLQGITLMIVALFARGMWYGPITIMKPILVFMILSLIFIIVPRGIGNRRKKAPQVYQPAARVYSKNDPPC